MNFTALIVTVLATLAFTTVSHANNHAPQTASKVFFASPKDGETVTGPVKVKMGLEGYTIGPVGDMSQTKGHHHIVVDGGPIKKGDVVPTDDKHLHFGKGQTETEVKLPPGKHTLTLQFADGAHRSYGPEMSSTVTVTVK